MQQFVVTGMSCAACSARVEKAVQEVEGVTSCSVSLLTNSMGVEGAVSESDIIAAVKAAGYDAYPKDAEKNSTKSKNDEDALKDTETPVLKRRLLYSLGFLVVLMYVSMGHTMFSLPLPSFLQGNPAAIGIVQMLLALVVMEINKKFFINGIKGVLHKAPNMDTLVAMGSAAAFAYSLATLFAITSAQAKGDLLHARHYLHNFYFESAAMILVLITVGKMLESRAKGKTTDALKGLMRLAPKTATLIQNGEEKTVPVESIKQGDIFAVRSGETIPVDGVVTDGTCAVDESSLTGESIPVDKEKGDSVSAATINQSGYIRCRATRVGEDTTLSQIIKMVSDAAATKAPIAKAADRVSGVFVPVVIGIALITLIIWLIAGQTFAFALARAISVLVISCPCALGLATPVAIMVGSGVGAKNGILFKTAQSLELAGRVETVVLDKTGTITLGEPKVTDIVTAKGQEKSKLLSVALALESKSEHPLAKAILQRAKDDGISAQEVEQFKVLAGNGLEGTLDGVSVCAGHYNFVSQNANVPQGLKEQAQEFADEGKTALYFAADGETIGIIAVADVIKEDSPTAVKELQNMGIHVVMLTGDNERTAEAIAKQTGVNEVIAGVLPNGKAEAIKKLKQSGHVAMVGDGINDAPALTSADVGIAIGAGTDIAIDAADIVLMKSSLRDVAAAIRLSRATLRNIYENLFWAFIYNSIGIPLAAGAFISLLGWELSPMFGAAAMSLSSFCVVMNALRLNFFKLHSTAHDRKRINKTKSFANSTNRTLTVEGMMCHHCEARVQNALEQLPLVVSATADYQTGKVEIKLKSDVKNALLKKTVEKQGYKVIKID